MLLTSPDYDNLVVQHALPRPLQSCDPLVGVVTNDVISMFAMLTTNGGGLFPPHPIMQHYVCVSMCKSLLGM